MIAEALQSLIKGRPRHSADRYAPVFIVGSGRSGNTLLRAMLSGSPEIHIPPETYVLGKVIRAWPVVSRLPWPLAVGRVLGAFETHREFASFDISLTQLRHDLIEDSTPMALADVLDRFYMFHAAREKPTATRWGDKTPLNVFHLPRIISVFPDARFIHLLRDGRDVVRSYLEMGRYSRVTQAANRWKRSVTSAERFAESHRGSMTTARYEDLVRSPTSELKRICEFVNLGYSPRMAESHLSALGLGDVSTTAHYENVLRPVSDRFVGQWREYFGADQRAELDRLIGSKLASCGYARDL